MKKTPKFCTSAFSCWSSLIEPFQFFSERFIPQIVKIHTAHAVLSPDSILIRLRRRAQSLSDGNQIGKINLMFQFMTKNHFIILSATALLNAIPIFNVWLLSKRIAFFLYCLICLILTLFFLLICIKSSDFISLIISFNGL